MDRITAAFDGKVLIPQEPVDWPVGKVVDVTTHTPSIEDVRKMTPDQAWEWLRSNPRDGGGAEFDRGDLYQ